jgi:hypothetical protein
MCDENYSNFFNFLELAHMNGKKFNVDQKQNDADG